MASSILKKLLAYFAFCCFLLLIQTFNSDKKLINIPETELNQLQKSFPEFYQAYLEVFNSKTDNDKLLAISNALSLAQKQQIHSPKLVSQLHVLAANIHQQRWHLNFAIDSLLKAQTFNFEQKIDRRIKRLRNKLQRSQTERDFNNVYVATRFSGPARELKGKVLVTYIFIDDGIKTRWSKKSRHRSEQVLQQVEKWQQTQSTDYQVENIEFINKQFIIQRNPQLKELSSISYKSKSKDIDRFVNLIMRSLGSNDVGEFIQQQMRLADADQGVVIFHSNLDKRSFARRCGYTHSRTFYKNGKRIQQMISNCQQEYVMLTEQVKRNRWDKLHYVQAHEILHLFGADDLYRIKNAARYALTDIMNFQSRYLADASIDPITAYAIGWQQDKPQAPFKIIDR